MKSILTMEIVQEAIDLALPSIRAICQSYNWGPQGVVIAVGGNIFDQPFVYVMDELGPRVTWKERYEGCDFEEIALEKLEGALRTGRPNVELIRTPWRLRLGDSFYQGAVAEDTDLAVAVSGSYEEIDEACARIVWNFITAICTRRFKELQKQDVTRL